MDIALAYDGIADFLLLTATANPTARSARSV